AIGATRDVGEERDALFEGNQGLNGRDLGTPAGYLRLTLVRPTEVKHLLTQAVHLVEQNEAFASQILDGNAASPGQRVVRGKGDEEGFCQERLSVEPVIRDRQRHQREIKFAFDDGLDDVAGYVFAHDQLDLRATPDVAFQGARQRI